MPKRKPSDQSAPRKKARAKTSPPSSEGKTPKSASLRSSTRGQKASRPPAAQPSVAPNHYSEEYAEYLERYELYGEDRPRLSPAEFERLDEEMLDLLALETEQGLLDDDQIVRLQELEYLLLDSEQ